MFYFFQDSKTHYARVVGPIIMVLGFVLFAFAFCLCCLAYKAAQEEREKNYFARTSKVSAISQESPEVKDIAF